MDVHINHFESVKILNIIRAESKSKTVFFYFVTMLLIISNSFVTLCSIKLLLEPIFCYVQNSVSFMFSDIVLSPNR